MIYESSAPQAGQPIEVEYRVGKYRNSFQVRRMWTDEAGKHSQLVAEFYGDYEDLATETADRLKIRDLVAALKSAPTGEDDG